jgi:hypothetical protein
MESPPTGQDVAGFLGRGSDTAFVALCNVHVPLVTAFVRSYVRGQGFDKYDDMEEDLRAVIITATARLVVNPAQVEREGADSYYAVGSFNGFSLPELAVLHNFRRRTA